VPEHGRQRSTDEAVCNCYEARQKTIARVHETNIFELTYNILIPVRQHCFLSIFFFLTVTRLIFWYVEGRVIY